MAARAPTRALRAAAARAPPAAAPPVAAAAARRAADSPGAPASRRSPPADRLAPDTTGSALAVAAAHRAARRLAAAGLAFALRDLGPAARSCASSSQEDPPAPAQVTPPFIGRRARERASSRGQRLGALLRRSRPLGPQAPLEQRRCALITISGQTHVSSRNDIWCGIASVMGQVSANIEESAGTFMHADASAAGHLAGSLSGAATSSFLVSAFDTHIAPFSTLPCSPETGARGDMVAVALFVKVSVAETSVPIMSHLLHTRFPRLVCTVTSGGMTPGEEAELGQEEAQAAESEGPPSEGYPLRPERVITGVIRLFGLDKVGQLARMTEVLASCQVTILNLLVTQGFHQTETLEFFERVGGPLSENVVTIAAFERAAFDEAALRSSVAEAAQDVGYHVTSIILDGQRQAIKSQELANYYLRRKEFMKNFSAPE